MYQMRKKLKDPEYLTPEEVDVQNALKDYKPYERGGKVEDFVPSDVLYETYRTYFNKLHGVNGDPDLLTLRGFGAALRRVFPELEEDDERRGRTTINGKRCWGFSGLSGPGAIPYDPQRGRPKGSHKAAPAPAKIPRRNEEPSKRRYADPYRDEVRPLRPPNGRRR